MTTQLDPGQAIKAAYDETGQAFRVEDVGGGALVPEPYDFIILTYVAAGNGAGQIETATYKSGGAGGTTVAVLTLTYDASNRLSTTTRT